MKNIFLGVLGLSLWAPWAEAGRLKLNSNQTQSASCAEFEFGADDSPVSPKVELQERQDCRWRPGNPRDGRPDEWDCWPPVPQREVVQITLRGRQALFPWEYDAFRVCLESHGLSLSALETAYEYRRERGGGRGDIVLVPVKKIQMNPDRRGIAAELLSSTLVLTLKDKWAAHYVGEQTVLKLKLKKKVRWAGDPTVSELELVLTPAPSYAVQFPTKDLETGAQYYAEISFVRRGAVSRQKEMQAGETAPVVYQPGLAGR